MILPSMLFQLFTVSLVSKQMLFVLAEKNTRTATYIKNLTIYSIMTLLSEGMTRSHFEPNVQR